MRHITPILAVSCGYLLGLGEMGQCGTDDPQAYLWSWTVTACNAPYGAMLLFVLVLSSLTLHERE